MSMCIGQIGIRQPRMSTSTGITRASGDAAAADDEAAIAEFYRYVPRVLNVSVSERNRAAVAVFHAHESSDESAEIEGTIRARHVGAISACRVESRRATGLRATDAYTRVATNPMG